MASAGARGHSSWCTEAGRDLGHCSGCSSAANEPSRSSGAHSLLSQSLYPWALAAYAHSSLSALAAVPCGAQACWPEPGAAMPGEKPSSPGTKPSASSQLHSSLLAHTQSFPSTLVISLALLWPCSCTSDHHCCPCLLLLWTSSARENLGALAEVCGSQAGAAAEKISLWPSSKASACLFKAHFHTMA